MMDEGRGGLGKLGRKGVNKANVRKECKKKWNENI
jgi:hypothetical protein